MLTYVVAANRGQFLDYCRMANLHPAAARLVRSPADLAGVDVARNRVVLYGEYAELPEIVELLELVFGAERAAA
jgi:hypothetical protein